MPKNHRTVNDSYSAVFPDDVEGFVFGQFSLQGKDLQLKDVNLRGVLELFEEEHGPIHVDIDTQIQSNDYTNIIFLVIGYMWMTIQNGSNPPKLKSG